MEKSLTLWYHTEAQDILSPDDPYWDRGINATDYFGRDTHFCTVCGHTWSVDDYSCGEVQQGSPCEHYEDSILKRVDGEADFVLAEEVQS